MKKSKAVEILLKHSLALTNEDQALHTIEILERYVGMLPPDEDGFCHSDWDDEKESKSYYVIVNNNVVKAYYNYTKADITIKNGLRYSIGGWSIIDKPSEAYDRQMIENVIWAKQRMKWAVDNAPDEIAELAKIIETKGESRTPEYYSKLKDLK
jgi:hypothetical protein